MAKLLKVVFGPLGWPESPEMKILKKPKIFGQNSMKRGSFLKFFFFILIVIFYSFQICPQIQNWSISREVMATQKFEKIFFLSQNFSKILAQIT